LGCLLSQVLRDLVQAPHAAPGITAGDDRARAKVAEAIHAPIGPMRIPRPTALQFHATAPSNAPKQILDHLPPPVRERPERVGSHRSDLIHRHAFLAS
jgi:hypothetical protein